MIRFRTSFACNMVVTRNLQGIYKTWGKLNMQNIFHMDDFSLPPDILDGAPLGQMSVSHLDVQTDGQTSVGHLDVQTDGQTSVSHLDVQTDGQTSVSHLDVRTDGETSVIHLDGQTSLLFRRVDKTLLVL